MPVDYRAPLADMHFIVHQLIPLSRIQALPGYEEVDDDLVNTILEEASKFANQVLSPINWTGDQEGCILEHAVVKTPSGFKDAYQQYIEAGWISLAANPNFGGQGLPASLATPVNEMWHSANMAFMLCPMLTAGAIEAKYNKLEVQRFQEEIDQMNHLYGGVKDLAARPGAVFVVDVINEANALREAKKLGLKTIAIADTNVDPTDVTYPIPANDDAIKTIELILDYIKQAIEEGKSKQKAAKPADKEGDN